MNMISPIVNRGFFGCVFGHMFCYFFGRQSQCSQFLERLLSKTTCYLSSGMLNPMLMVPAEFYNYAICKLKVGLESGLVQFAVCLLVGP